MAFSRWRARYQLGVAPPEYRCAAPVRKGVPFASVPCKRCIAANHSRTTYSLRVVSMPSKTPLNPTPDDQTVAGAKAARRSAAFREDRPAGEPAILRRGAFLELCVFDRKAE
jgi:hypothetical protein